MFDTYHSLRTISTSVAHSLIDIVKALSYPTIPEIPPKVTAYIPRINTIRAVAFDVYGTLVHSAAGEISITEPTYAQEITFPHFNMRIPIEYIQTALHERIHAIHAEKKDAGIEYPEVDIVQVWMHLLQNHAAFSHLSITPEHMHDQALYTALYYELAVNPVCLMPGAQEIIRTLHSAGIPMGIVSNAQFYTPFMLEAFLGNLWSKSLFTACVWSYKIGEAKPSEKLYRILLKQWSNYEPHEILFVGNDMRNDIAPAMSRGIKTALFAGDISSYRPRQDIKELNHVKADSTILSLDTIVNIIGL